MVNSPKLRRFVRHALVAATGTTSPNRMQLASAFDVLCDQLRTRLRPLFGATAISALFARALHLSTIEFPWLADVLPKDGERCSLDGIDAAAEAIPSQFFEEGLTAVLAHDIGLLATFIGDDFVMPLVQEAWGTTVLVEWSAQSEGDS
jgi:hypothetical protein